LASAVVGDVRHKIGLVRNDANTGSGSVCCQFMESLTGP
jgi:hypothetical protein